MILKADRLYAELLRQYILREYPRARVNLVTSVEAAAVACAAGPIGLLVTGVGGSAEGDVLDFLARVTGQETSPRRVIVVTVRREFRLFSALRTLDVDGVFDPATEPPEQFTAALRSVTGGTRYWSPGIVDYMRDASAAPDALLRVLTSFEQVVLSVIGDGCDDSSAGSTLGLSPATISTVRRDLHRKLRVQHRGELVRIAAQHGFVRFTSAGVVRPGFEMLAAAYHRRRAKRLLPLDCEAQPI